MIKLRVVGTSDDHEKLILSNKARGTRGSHVVTIDKRLLDALSDAMYARRQAKAEQRAAAFAIPERVEPKVPPKEVQQQLRAGKGVEQVAATTGLSEAYVRRLEGPVTYERIEVINEAQERAVEKPRAGRSALALGAAVEANLASRRVTLDEDRLAGAWHATRRGTDPWVVTFSFPYRGRARTARWIYDPRARTLTAANRIGAEMGWAARGARRTAAGKPSIARKKPSARKKTTARRKATARKKPTARRKTTARKKPSARRKTARRKATARKKPTTRRKTTTRRKPARRRRR